MSRRSREEENDPMPVTAEDAGVGTDVVEASEINEDSRIPFGSVQARLDYPSRKGYYRYWFNDSPGRIARALAAGYKHVLDSEGKVVHRPVGTNGAGGGLLSGYLMEVPYDWHQRDMLAQQSKNDQLDADIRRGNVAGTVGQDGRYVPESRPIKITRS